LFQDFNATNFVGIMVMVLSNILGSKGQNVGVGRTKSQPLF